MRSGNEHVVRCSGYNRAGDPDAWIKSQASPFIVSSSFIIQTASAPILELKSLLLRPNILVLNTILFLLLNPINKTTCGHP
jgi:hypothetical protein